MPCARCFDVLTRKFVKIMFDASNIKINRAFGRELTHGSCFQNSFFFVGEFWYVFW